MSSIAGIQDASIAVLLIESGLWTRYSPTAEGIATEIHVDGLEGGERVIVTRETVLRALLDGKLALPPATDLAVLIVVPPAWTSAHASLQAAVDAPGSIGNTNRSRRGPGTTWGAVDP